MNPMLYCHYIHICLYLNHRASLQKNPSPELLSPPFFRLRGLVFDWLTHLAGELEISNRSLYLAFDFYDIFLTTGNEANSRHQLYFFGLASLFIASKYEEIYPPSLKEFIAGSSNVLQEDPSNQDLFFLSEEPRIALFSALLLKTEEKLLQSLNFETSRVLTFDFLNIFACDIGLESSPKILNFAHFLIVIAQLNPELIGIPKILLGFSSLYLSNRLFGNAKKWPKLKQLKKNLSSSNQPKMYLTLNLFSKAKTARYHIHKHKGHKSVEQLQKESKIKSLSNWKDSVNFNESNHS
jgi:hypothetical protein